MVGDGGYGLVMVMVMFLLVHPTCSDGGDANDQYLRDYLCEFKLVNIYCMNKGNVSTCQQNTSI